jgi:hypothetical protein
MTSDGEREQGTVYVVGSTVHRTSCLYKNKGEGKSRESSFFYDIRQQIIISEDSTQQSKPGRTFTSTQTPFVDFI